MSQYRPVTERVKDYRPVELRLTDDELNRELKRCQDCGIPFCHASGCPLANIIPEINSDALHGRWDTAYARLLLTSPFPEFTARVCPALCEGSCVQALNESPVPARQIEYEVIERAFETGLVSPVKPLARLNLRVGIVGSGPAGLAAAQSLTRAGCQVTVYEKDKKSGGFLRYGIPDFKLEKSVIDRRLDLMRDERVVFYNEVDVGSDISIRLLKKRHQVLVLALGSRRKRDLSIPGRDLPGILFATDYLSAQNRINSGEIAALPAGFDARGLSVVVIGGGDTGSDCVGTAWRQGAAEVKQLEIMPQPPQERAPENPWPQWPRILRTTSSHLEGGERRWNIDTLAFLPGPSGRTGSLKCRQVRWEEQNGRLIRPIPLEGSEFELKADLVLLAMGFVSPEFGNLTAFENFKTDSEGRLEPGVYACGDAVSGPSLVVRAINSGLNVARAILQDQIGLALPETGS
ncbi:MAG: glutamate synthase subunit beta [Deltaproteobacteria bacterium]|jgi:glutamate synthase (NADPH/NADH) small chain|nr:glutamate synthase subunit beta [Deltaproteobacteria bacterium]